MLQGDPPPQFQALAQALAMESRTSARCAVFAQKAGQEGREHLARFFRAAGQSQSVQAHRYLMLLRGRIGSTLAKVEEAFLQETREKEALYQELIAQARQEGQGAGANAMEQSALVESGHAQLLDQARQRGGGQAPLDYLVCQVCGYLAQGQAPERCPVCGAVPAKFKTSE